MWLADIQNLTRLETVRVDPPNPNILLKHEWVSEKVELNVPHDAVQVISEIVLQAITCAGNKEITAK